MLSSRTWNHVNTNISTNRITRNKLNNTLLPWSLILNRPYKYNLEIFSPTPYCYIMCMFKLEVRNYVSFFSSTPPPLPTRQINQLLCDILPKLHLKLDFQYISIKLRIKVKNYYNTSSLGRSHQFRN